MEDFLLKSHDIPTLFVVQVLPSAYRLTPVHWGAREDAVPFTYQRAEALQSELALNGINVNIIRNGDLTNGRSGTKLQ